MTRPSLARTAVLVLAVAALLPAGAAWGHPGMAADYHWVEPPPGFEGLAPPAEGRDVVLTPELLVTGRADVWTPDLQAVVSVVVDLPPEPVRVVIEPLAPWEGLYDGLSPIGNAVRVTLDGPVREATVSLRSPAMATSIATTTRRGLYARSARPGPDGTVSARWDGPGPYLAIGPLPPLAPVPDTIDVFGAVRAGLVTGGLTALGIGLVRRRRRPHRTALTSERPD